MQTTAVFANNLTTNRLLNIRNLGIIWFILETPELLFSLIFSKIFIDLF